MMVFKKDIKGLKNAKWIIFFFISPFSDGVEHKNV